MQEKKKYINEHESPITVSTDRDSDETEALHNILTQDIMLKEIREDLLEFEISCNSRNEMFRTEILLQSSDPFLTPPIEITVKHPNQ